MRAHEKVNTKSSRTYLHRVCGEVTQIADSPTDIDYTLMCNPFQHVRATYCMSCGRAGPLGQFEWIETGETLADYRKRIRKSVPAWLWAVHYLIGLLWTFGAAAGVWWLTGRWWAGLIMLVVGWVVHRITTPLLSAKVGGVDLRNEL